LPRVGQGSVVCRRLRLEVVQPGEHVLGLFLPLVEYANSGGEQVLKFGERVGDLLLFGAIVRRRLGRLRRRSSTALPSRAGGLLVAAAAGIAMTHVPYKGAAELSRGLMSGEVQLAFHSLMASVSQIKQGQLKAIACGGLNRSPVLPDVPTVAQSGLPGFQVGSSLGFLVPAATPRTIVNKIAADIATVVKQPDVVAKLVGLGIEPIGGSADDFAAQLRADAERYAVAVKAAGMKAE